MGYYSEMEVRQRVKLSNKFEKIFNEISNGRNFAKPGFSNEAEKIYAEFRNKIMNSNWKDEWICIDYLNNYIIKDGYLEVRDGYAMSKNYADRLLCVLLMIIAKHTGDKLDIELKFTGEDGEMWGFYISNKKIKTLEYEIVERLTGEEFEL